MDEKILRKILTPLTIACFGVAILTVIVGVITLRSENISIGIILIVATIVNILWNLLQ